jgi:SAM-dependent methyltransferase
MNAVEKIGMAGAVRDARAVNAAKFERHWRSSKPWRERLQYNLEAARKDFLHALRTLGLKRSGQRVLDVGFGNGMLMFLFDRTCALYGTEFSAAAIERAERQARRRGYREFCFRAPECEQRLPFAREFFDVAIASHVIEHVEADRELLREMMRTLKPGGHLVVIAPLEARGEGPLSEAELINPAYLEQGHFHVRRYNLTSLLARLEGLPGRVVFQMCDASIWSWKASLDPWRQRLTGRRLGRLADRLLAAAINIPLSLAPRRLLAWLDGRLAARGYPAAQAVLVVRKDAG